MSEIPFHSNQEPRLLSLEKDTRGQIHRKAIDEKLGEAFLNHWHDARNRILETIPPRDENIDIKGAQKFFYDKGLATRPHILLLPENIPMLQEILTDAGIAPETFDTDRFIGGYLHQLGIGYVIRDPEQEAFYGPAYTEAILVHEMAHSSGNYYVISIEKDKEGMSYGHNRVGHKIDGQGSFYEEGFASLVETEYIQQKLQLQNGFSHLEGMVTLENGLALPGKYLTKNREEGYTGGSCAYAAYGLELLNTKDPQIIPTLYRARNDVEGLREFAHRVNALSPGLYKQLRGLTYTNDDLRTGLELVQKAVGQL